MINHCQVRFEGPVRSQLQPLLAAIATTTSCLTYKNSQTMTATADNQLVTSCCWVPTGSNQSQPIYMYINL
jgi:hypothetical protein